MNNIILLIGYLASVLLAISLLVNNDLKFRWLNAFGCLSFIIYGVLIGAIPIVITNLILVFINLFYLLKIYRTKEDFDLLEFRTDDKIIQKFLSYHKKDIHSYFPDFRLREDEADIKFVVLRDMAIANIFMATITGNGIGMVKINYTVPKYRDYKVGRFIFEKENKLLVSKGIRQLMYEKVFNKGHEEFLKVMGFEKSVVGGEEHWVKRL